MIETEMDTHISPSWWSAGSIAHELLRRIDRSFARKSEQSPQLQEKNVQEKLTRWTSVSGTFRERSRATI